MPMTETEIVKVKENMASMLKLNPCTEQCQTIDLIFYFNRDMNSSIVKFFKDVQSLTKGYYRNFGLLFANLSHEQDTYPLGASLMFFDLLKSGKLSDKYDKFFLMEADVIPCRENWLDQVYKQSIGEFWMKGSILRYPSASQGTSNFAEHINGNAIYSLSPNFQKFLQMVESKFLKHSKRYLDSYDIAIYTILHDRYAVSYEQFTDWVHLFVYSDFIVNVYRRKILLDMICRQNPSTFLVHGRYV